MISTGWRWGAVPFAVGVLLLLVLATVATDGVVDLVLLVLAAGLLVAGHAARRYARNELLYRDRDGSHPAAGRRAPRSGTDEEGRS